MFTYTLSQGEDKRIRIPVFDKATNNAIDLTLATDIIADVTQNKLSVAKYSLNEITGYEDLLIYSGSGSPNEVQFDILRDTSKNFSIGSTDVSVLVELPDTDFSTGEAHTDYVYSNYILINESFTKDINI